MCVCVCVLAGNLSVLYLGTEPPKQTIAFSESRQLDYAAMEEERVALLAKLRAAGGSAGLDAAAAAKAEAKAAGGSSSSQAPLVLKAKVPSRLDSSAEAASSSMSISGSFGAGLGGGIGGGQQGGSSSSQQLTVTLLLTNTTKAPLQVRGCSWRCLHQQCRSLRTLNDSWIEGCCRCASGRASRPLFGHISKALCTRCTSILLLVPVSQ